MVKVLHLISDLDTGGAEMMLYKLVKNMDRTRFANVVISMKDMGSLGERIEDAGATVYTLGMSRGLPNPLSLWRLYCLLRREQPLILQTWLYHADLVGLITGKLAATPYILWNLRCSYVDMKNYSIISLIVLKMLARLSHFPWGVITNSKNGQKFHQEYGYSCRKWIFMPNGFELDSFFPQPEARHLFRKDLGLSDEAILIGIIARFDPMKGHYNFLKAADIIIKKFYGKKDIHFVLVGREIDENNQSLTSCIESLAIEKHVHMLGERNDIPYINSALDIVSSASLYGEGFPNAIGEAMACEVPCVVTDIGDSAYVVGNAGIVVPPHNHYAMANAWAKILLMDYDDRRLLGRTARERIVSLFSIENVAKQYENLYSEISKIHFSR